MYHGQYYQDAWLNENLFKNKKNGFFIDIGANDGLTFSNSYFFETKLKWSGICIEPSPDIFKNLIKNRKCICLNNAINNESGSLDFLNIRSTTSFSNMLSGLMDTFDEKCLYKLEEDLKILGGEREIIKVDCITLKYVFENYIKKNTLIDFISIDTEGSELNILKSLDINKFDINYFIIENAFRDNNNIEDYMNKNNYEIIHKLPIDDIYGKINEQKG